MIRGLFFESPDVRCVKNVKRFLFFSWHGYHKPKILRVQRWGAISWHEYEVELQCELCGAKLHRFGITHSEMLLAGIDPADYDCG